MKKEVLLRAFPREQIRQRPGQHGQTLHYVDIGSVIARLNEGCEHWDFTIEKYEVLDGEVLVLGRLVADGVTKSAFGGSTITIDRDGVVVSIADDLKAAASDSLKKCASLLGVALELYGGAAAEEPKPTRPRLTSSERATSKQVAAIHSASRRRGYSRERLQALLFQKTGKNEASELTRREASSVIEELSQGNGASA